MDVSKGNAYCALDTVLDHAERVLRVHSTSLERIGASTRPATYSELLRNIETKVADATELRARVDPLLNPACLPRAGTSSLVIDKGTALLIGRIRTYKKVRLALMSAASKDVTFFLAQQTVLHRWLTQNLVRIGVRRLIDQFVFSVDQRRRPRTVRHVRTPSILPAGVSNLAERRLSPCVDLSQPLPRISEHSQE